MKEQHEFQVTKSTVECYKIRHPSGMYWADITVDGKDRQVRIQIASDYGDYQYYWGACGPNYKDFLRQLGMDYAARKFGADRHFDHEATIHRFKRDVIDARRIENIGADEARALWDQIKDLENYTHQQEFIHAMFQRYDLTRFYDHCPSLVKGITPQFREFWNTVWPVFLNELTKETRDPGFYPPTHK